MKHYKSPTPKSTLLWSNSSIVSIFKKGKLSRAKLQQSTVRTTDQYVDAKGRKRFKGNKNLKATQQLVCIHACLRKLVLVRFFCYTSSALGPVTEPRTYTVHFARKVVQSAPLLKAQELKDWVVVS